MLAHHEHGCQAQPLTAVQQRNRIQQILPACLPQCFGGPQAHQLIPLVVIVVGIAESDKGGSISRIALEGDRAQGTYDLEAYFGATFPGQAGRSASAGPEEVLAPGSYLFFRQTGQIPPPNAHGLSEYRGLCNDHRTGIAINTDTDAKGQHDSSSRVTVGDASNDG